MPDTPEIIRLRPSWAEACERLEALGFDGLRMLAARHGVELGHYSERCDYVPDPEIWDWYRGLPPQP